MGGCYLFFLLVFKFIDVFIEEIGKRVAVACLKVLVLVFINGPWPMNVYGCKGCGLRGVGGADFF